MSENDSEPPLKSTEGDYLLGSNNQRVVSAKERWYLYVCHFLQTFGDRMWSFAVPILFMNIWTDTLFPSALFSFFLYASVGLCMARTGKWIDRTDRLSVMRVAVWGQNLCVILNCTCFVAIILFCGYDIQGEMEWTPSLGALFACLLISASAAEVCGNAATLAIEKDWVVVLYPNPKDLAQMNVTLRRIDLMCKLVAPTVFGAVVQMCPTIESQLFVGIGFAAGFNALGLLPEYYMARHLYLARPELRSKTLETHEQKDEGPRLSSSSFGAWSVYFRSHVFWACFSYSALYLTVLDCGILMTAYLKWLGIPESFLGLGRGAGAVFGLLGTSLFPIMLRCMSLRVAGVVTVWGFFITVAPAALNFLNPAILLGADASNYSIGVAMLVSVAVSRVFLWSFDLSHSQIIQLEIGSDTRAQVAACQTATYQAFWIVLYALALFFSSPKQFGLLTFVSVGSVMFAAIVWTLFAIKSRGVQSYTSLRV